jgi:hypothetical protein
MPARRFIKNNPEELAAYLKSLASGLVVFDGRSGAGKTPLAADMAKRLGCKSADADRCFLDHQRRMFVGALRLDEMRTSLNASLATSPLVLFSAVCARQAVEMAKLSATAFIWVEHASLVRLDSAEGQFDDYDDDAAPPGIHQVHDEIEAYISAYNARRRLDQIVYLNAYDD